MLPPSQVLRYSVETGAWDTTLVNLHIDIHELKTTAHNLLAVGVMVQLVYMLLTSLQKALFPLVLSEGAQPFLLFRNTHQNSTNHCGMVNSTP